VDAPELLVRTASPEDTRDIAAALAAHLVAGDVVALSGELGAGKTCFVQGAARGLDVDRPVTSPTFVLVRHYEGRLPVVHCDVYRLDRLGDVLQLGDEVLASDVVTFVEWGDAIVPLLPDDRLDVELSTLPVSTDGDAPAGDGLVAAPGEERAVRVRLHGRTADRHDALCGALAPWQPESC
jgi:tRNA threonylcarbamoyladenosine biosynthesis protein TsaE